MSDEIIHVPAGAVASRDFMPVFDITQAVERQKAMSEFIGKILHEGGDYGVIPGTNKQKVLLKPGAEKLCTFFGLSPRFEAEMIVEDWTGKAEGGGEPLFYYRYKCMLFRGERLLAEAVGSCNSREKKYRYRGGERKCPECGKGTIITGKAEYGGGFVCFKKKGGCGAKFDSSDPAITSQEVGQVINPDIADSVNTIQKIAQKRALVAAVLIGTNASDSFTQDLEEELDRASDAQETPPLRPDHAAKYSDPEELSKLLADLAAAKKYDDKLAVLERVYWQLEDLLGQPAAKPIWDEGKKLGNPEFMRFLYNRLQLEKTKAAQEQYGDKEK